MKKFKTLFLAVSIVLVTGSVAIADMHGKATMQKAIDHATSQYKMAVKSGFAWTKTAGMLKKAQAALDKGEHATAEKLTNKALKQANDALAQAKDSKDNWQDYIPKNS